MVTDHDMGIDRQIVVEDTRKFYGELCASWFNHPEKRLKAYRRYGNKRQDHYDYAD